MTRSISSLVISSFLFFLISHAANSSVLVLGGTGQLGSEIVKDLVEAGEDVTVMARPTSNRDRLADLDIRYVIGNALNEEDMERIFLGTSYRAVIDASGQPFGGDQTYYEKSQLVISKWAKAGGVQQIILHGATGAGDSAKMFFIENIPEFQRISIASKSIAEDILKGSGVPYTIIRHMTLLPLEFTESGNAYLTEDRTVVGAISRDGLARLTIECLDNDDCINTTLHAVDLDVELGGRYENMWKRYEMVIKPEYLESMRKNN